MVKQKRTRICHERSIESSHESGTYTVNKKKCLFFKPQIKFLGYILDQNGIHTDHKKIAAIEKAPKPANVKQLQAFLGFFSAYHKYIPDAASILTPLHPLLQKNTKWLWSLECNKAFAEVKNVLIKSNFLAHFNPHLPCNLRKDGSPYGIAGVLIQIVGKEERPIAFASCTLTVTEQKYAQLDKEALAILFCLEKFNKYLLGHEFILETDNKALTYIFNPKRPLSKVVINRLQRYVLILSGYNYRIQHIPARKKFNCGRTFTSALRNVIY